MDKFPLLWKERSVGELTAEREALYTCFSVRCALPGEGLWCAWAVGDRGELRLGVLEPQGDAAVLRRRFSHRMTAPAGRLLRGEVRPASPPEEAAGDWAPAEAEALFAVPYDPRRPVPLTGLFCFARPCRVRGERYWVYAFDSRERPVL